MWHAYIIKSSQDSRYYIGYTEDLERRIRWHNQGKSQWTKKFIPWTLVYSEKFDLKSKAIQREKQIKRCKSRRYIEKLIESSGPVV